LIVERVVEKVYTSFGRRPNFGHLSSFSYNSEGIDCKGCERSTRVRLEYLKLLESSERCMFQVY
jgi:hypothetical protein